MNHFSERAGETQPVGGERGSGWCASEGCVQVRGLVADFWVYRSPSGLCWKPEPGKNSPSPLGESCLMLCVNCHFEAESDQNRSEMSWALSRCLVLVDSWSLYRIFCSLNQRSKVFIELHHPRHRFLLLSSLSLDSFILQLLNQGYLCDQSSSPFSLSLALSCHLF